ncbi:Atu2307/SP_0267 family LLM class monooxygenase [Chryseobacterium sp. PTM-20240506]|uniref:Atu2307/SP_0267 family LLM class monooxygenase n=1 Tax=unclassified Chryseobacterium TaxID=2593645 RepID=UPI00235961A5|nr:MULTISPECIES: Atu2307/SP_0267 family LLM class monooxygenase [unclassified Chryseobacterium]MDC8103391.1 LLM class flavin-dependent oxidoreductase [Chryseobacterium sp. B21-037]MDQ1802948.1 LLM class flavin-dependent oxidoreductase [Chryseobacterium sp. CKR4-1]
MEIGIDSFASAMYGTTGITPDLAMKELLERIELADQVGLSVFGIGEHHKKGFLDSAPAVILAAAAARTKKIRLASAVVVLGAADPVRLFQSFATLDIISEGRTEMVVGRGSSIEAYPLFGLNLSDYDELFHEKLNLLLEIRKNEFVTWSGKFRSKLDNLPVYPRPLQEKLPIWLGVGGTPASFERAGRLGLPLMVAVIGGFTERFRPLVDIYREAGAKAGFRPEDLKVGLHSPGYVAENDMNAIAEYYPGHVDQWNRIGKERGWAPITRSQFDLNVSPKGVLVVGGPEAVAEKIINHSESLGGIQRFTFQMDNAGLSHSQLMKAIELIGSKVIPTVNMT